MKTPLFAAAVLAVGLPIALSAAQQSPGSKPAPAYKDVAPFFTANCIRCHIGDRAPRQIDLSSYKMILEGGEQGPVVRPGAPKHSLLIRALRGDGVRRMPPRGEALPEAQIVQIENWIRAGAKP